MTISRRHSLALFGAALLLPQCGGEKTGGTRAIRVGSKNFGENIIVAELYAQALEQAGFTVERRMNLGSTQIAMAALQRGDIDLYPEYTGTGLIDVLHLPPMRDAHALYETVKREYAQRYQLTWLRPSPANDSQGLAITRRASQEYRVRTLSQAAKAAPQLRLAAVPEFVARADALPGLQRYYGGFHFKDVKTYDIGLQYDALVRGDADVSTAFTTDAQIEADKLVLLEDDRHFWPAYNVAPVVRNDVLRAHPQIAGVLNAVNAHLTTRGLTSLNYAYTVRKEEPADIIRPLIRGLR
jgi:osmoprotectant transport system substrate-binding protein